MVQFFEMNEQIAMYNKKNRALNGCQTTVGYRKKKLNSDKKKRKKSTEKE